MSKRFTDIEQLKIDHAKQYVDYIDGLKTERDNALNKIAFIEQMAQPGAIRYDLDSVATSPTDDAIPNAVSAMMEDKERYEEIVNSCNAEIEKFCLMLRFDVTGIGATYMYYHFRYGIPWNEIANTAGIDPSTERNRRYEALLEMYEKDLVPLEFRVPVYRAI